MVFAKRPRMDMHTKEHSGSSGEVQGCISKIPQFATVQAILKTLLMPPRSSAFAERMRGVGHHCTQCNGVAINRQAD